MPGAFIHRQTFQIILYDTRRIAVGIDLGTTNSVVAYLTPEGETRVLPNSEGEPLTPSVVVFADDSVVVGKAARAVGAHYLDRTAECAKRDMGLPHYHRAIGDRLIPPEAIQGYVLRKLSRDINDSLAGDCEVVVTVPAYFDEARRHATMAAAKVSGLHVIDIVNEPTAAALAFGQRLGYLDPKGQARQRLRVLVYDLGGGTFDVTVIELKDKAITTLATDGDVRLGGYDWDMRLVEHARQTIKAKYPELPALDDQANFHLRRQMELIKHKLSSDAMAQTIVSYLGKSTELTVTRDDLEDLTADLMERTGFTTRQTLRAAGLTWADIDHILLVGGSTRMPMVSRMLADLSGKTPENAVHPDEAVARGAAIFCFLKQREAVGDASSARLRITDVASHSLGIEGIDDRTLRKENFTLIPKNTPLPAKIEREFVTKEDNQENVLVRLLEGESKQPEHCSELARARINNLPQGLPKGTKVKVTYSFDSSGRLSVEANIPGLGREAKMELQRERAMPHARLEQWKKLICEDGGFSKIERLASQIDSALLEQEANPPLSPTIHETKPMSLQPAASHGAALAAAEVLQQAFAASSRTNPQREPTVVLQRNSPDRLWTNVIGYVVFSVLGTLLGVYIVCRVHPSLREYLPDAVVEFLFKS